MRETLVKTEEFKDSPLGRIPKDWKVDKFEKLADAIDPQPDHRAPPEVNDGEPYIGVGDFRPDGSIDFNSCRKVSSAAVTKQQQRFSIEPGDIIFGKIGTIGLPKFLPQVGRRYALNANTVLIKPRGCASFVMWLLQSNFVEQQILVETHSTSQPAFGILRIRAMLVPIPEPEEQKRIAEILDRVDEAIAHTSSLIAKLKQMKAGLLHDLLTRGLDENGELRDAIAHPEQFKDSPLGQIPKDWEVVPLTTLCHKITDGSHQSVKTSDSGVPFLYVSCVRDGQILWEQAAKIPEQTYAEISKGREPVPGLILYTAVGSYGHAALVREKYQFSFQRHIAYILANSESVEPAYLTMWLNSPQGRKYADQVALGNAQKTVTLGELASFPVLLPEIEEQRRITEILDAHETRIRQEEAYREKLKLQKQGLMHDLLTGKVRVKNA